MANIISKMPPSLLGSGATSSLEAVVTALLPQMEQPSDLSSSKDSVKGSSNAQQPNKDENLVLYPPEPSPEKHAATKRFWEYDLTSPNSNFIHQLTLVITTKLDTTERIKLTLLLYLLNSVSGTFLIFGSFKNLLRFRPFSKWTLSDRTRALQGMRDSNIEIKRAAFSGLKRLICGLALTFTSQEETDRKEVNQLNPFWEAMSYPGPIHFNTREDKDKLLRDVSGHGVFSSESAPADNPFISPPKGAHETLTFDVIIVGSGAGGSVAANNLAQAGYSVVVLEKGSYVPPNEISNLEAEAMDKMYDKHGMVTTVDGNIMILAGSTLGGGTSINWGCCLDTPDYVRREWEALGLRQFQPGLEGSEFDNSLKSIKQRIGCENKSGIPLPKRNQLALDEGECPPHNAVNTLFWNGCEALDYKVEETGSNFRHSDWDSAGYTCFGDRYGNKRGTLVTYLSDAVKTRNTKIIQNCTVESILTESLKPLSKGELRKKRACGVLARVDNEIFQIKARKCVICCAGSLHTPCLMLRSKMKNIHIGRHLKLHPVTTCLGVFHGKKNIRGTTKRKSSKRALEELPWPLSTSTGDGNIHCYLKAPMTTVCTEFQKINNGYGPRIECPRCVHIGYIYLFSFFLVWF